MQRATRNDTADTAVGVLSQLKTAAARKPAKGDQRFSARLALQRAFVAAPTD